MKSSAVRSAILLMVSAIPLPCLAETITQNAVIVTSTRLEDDTARLPSSVTIITAEDIRRSPAQTLPELLALQAGVATRSLYGNQAARANVDLRGFGASSTQNTLILLDGRRLNDIDLSDVNYAAIPIGNIERIEIIRGGGGVLYGDGAVGGAINIVTKQPGRGGTSGNITATGESHKTRRLETGVSHGDGSFAFNVFANSIDSGGYRRNNALTQNNVQTDFRWSRDRDQWFLKLAADDQSLRLAGARRVDPGAGIDELKNDRRGTATPNDYADQSDGALTMGYSRFLSTDRELTMDIGYRGKNQKSFADDYTGGGFTSYSDTDLVTVSFTPRLKSHRALFDQPGSFIAGVDYYRSQYNSDRSLNASTAGTPIHRLDVSQTSLAVYTRNISEIGRNSTLTAGARLQQVRLEAHDAFDPTAPAPPFGSSGAPDRNSRDNEHMLDLGLRRRLSGNWSVYGNLGRSVRFATVDEIFQADPDNNFFQTFSPLQPQTAENVDLGADYRAGETRFGFGIYRMDLRNEIHYNPHAPVFANENLDPTRRHGLTLSAGQRLAEKWRVTADYAYTRAVFRSGLFAGNEVPLVARDTGSLSLFWTPRQALMLSAAARYTGAKRFDNDQINTFQKIPAYTTVDLKLLGEYARWKWTATINNIFNEEAFDFGIRSTSSPGVYNAYPLPERIFSLSLGRDF